MEKPELKHVINTTCPWSGEPVRGDSLTRYRGAVVGFCNRGCRDRFERATRAFDAALEALAENAGSAP
ncbi:glutathione S-transferase [Maricaulis sp.]|uniref:glutathione S-transferase n=1 Tax=Maricaulis sp. TaxID=1486257 RepID=UPI003A923851